MLLNMELLWSWTFGGTQVPNGAGCMLGVAQLVLYAMYMNAKPTKSDQLSEKLMEEGSQAPEVITSSKKKDTKSWWNFWEMLSSPCNSHRKSLLFIVMQIFLFFFKNLQKRNIISVEKWRNIKKSSYKILPLPLAMAELGFTPWGVELYYIT